MPPASGRSCAYPGGRVPLRLGGIMPNANQPQKVCVAHLCPGTRPCARLVHPVLRRGCQHARQRYVEARERLDRLAEMHAHSGGVPAFRSTRVNNCASGRFSGVFGRGDILEPAFLSSARCWKIVQIGGCRFGPARRDGARVPRIEAQEGVRDGCEIGFSEGSLRFGSGYGGSCGIAAVGSPASACSQHKSCGNS